MLQALATDAVVLELTHASAEVSVTVFFLLSAMTIVEIVDAHQGFKIVTDNITTRKPRTLLWVVSVCLFIPSIIAPSGNTPVPHQNISGFKLIT